MRVPTTTYREAKRSLRRVSEHVPEISAPMWIGIALAALAIVVVAMPETRRYFKMEIM